MRQIGAALLVAAIAGCATVPPEEDPVQIKLNEHDGRLERIERVVSNQSLLDLAQRLDSLQADVRSLRGRIEELENSLETLRKQQRDLYSDLDQRLTQLSAGGVSGLAPGGAGTAAGAGEEAAYNQAFDALKNGNYGAAIAGFRQFLSAYPSSPLAENAQYWLGETYYVTRDYPSALTAFQAVVDRYPNSRKAPDALVKLGYTYFEMKRYAEARSTLNQVLQRYPDSEAARLAQERLARIPTAAR